MEVRKGFERFKDDLLDNFDFLIILGWKVDLIYEKPTYLKVIFVKNKLLLSLSAEYIGMALNFQIGIKNKGVIPFWKIFNELGISFDSHILYVKGNDYEENLKKYADAIKKNWIQIENFCQEGIIDKVE